MQLQIEFVRRIISGLVRIVAFFPLLPNRINLIIIMIIIGDDWMNIPKPSSFHFSCLYFGENLFMRVMFVCTYKSIRKKRSGIRYLNINSLNKSQVSKILI